MSEQQHDAAPTRRDGPPATPWWVKLLAVLAVLLVVAVITAQLLGTEHGPGLHGG